MAHSKLYTQLMNSKEWKRTRLAWLETHPLCARCAAQGYVVSAHCVHHLTPVESGHNEAECRRLAFSPANLQALCIRCHAEIHKAERSHSPAAHKQREQDRLKAWAEKHERLRAAARGTTPPAESEKGGPSI